MVFNPEFLSQQARKTPKTEKTTKKFSKKHLSKNTSHRFKKNTNQETKFKSEDFKPINSYEPYPWLISTAYDKENSKFKNMHIIE